MKSIFTKTFKGFLFVFFFSFSHTAFSQVPVANFKSCMRVIEQYETVEMGDLSSNTPYAWTWQVLDANGADMLASGDVTADPLSSGRDEYSKNPQFQFDLPGCYTIKLKANNMTGPSAIESKPCYIEVVAISSVYLGYGTYGPKGDNHVYNEYGSIIDDGGHNLNYSNNQGLNSRSFIKITPSNGRNITLKFYQLRLSNTGDSLSIYDADTVVAGKRLAVLTSANNGQSPVFNTTSSKMYIIFKSNATGTDSGYYGVFYTVNNPLLPISKQIKVIRNTSTLPSVFVNDNPTILARNYVRQWFVNDTLQSAFDNKDTLVHTFYNTNSYKVCIVFANCDSSDQKCLTGNNTLNLQQSAINGDLIYPNPFNNTINIVNSEALSYCIMDLMGKVVYHSETLNNTAVDLSFLSAGVYTIQFQMENGNKSIKLIKN